MTRGKINLCTKKNKNSYNKQQQEKENNNLLCNIFSNSQKQFVYYNNSGICTPQDCASASDGGARQLRQEITSAVIPHKSGTDSIM